jgi:hypothetical protein
VLLRWCLLRNNLKWSVKEKCIDVSSDIKISYLDDVSLIVRSYSLQRQDLGQRVGRRNPTNCEIQFL